MVCPRRTVSELSVESSRQGRQSQERRKEEKEETQTDGAKVHVDGEAKAQLHESQLKRKVRDPEVEARPHEGIVCPQHFAKDRTKYRARQHESD